MKKRTLMCSVARTRKAWDQYVRKIASELGIPESYRRTLLFLHRHPGAGQKDIADFEAVTTSAVNQVVKHMEGDGYVRKEADPADKRSSRLFLTEKGLEIARSLLERLEEADGAITRFLSPEKEEELQVLLEGLTQYIRKDLNGC